MVWYNDAMKKILLGAWVWGAMMTAWASVHVPLEVTEGTGMRFVRGEVAGVPCRLLVDTGATHTTFNLSFVTNRFPQVPLHPVQVTGSTNVRQTPKLFPLRRLQVGAQTLASPGAMAVPLDDLRASIGEDFDAILGMSDLSTIDFILSDRELVFAPTDEERRGFGPDARKGGDAFNPIVSGTCDEREIRFLIDSASTHTFVKEGMWRASTNEVAFSATAIDGHAQLRQRVGEKGVLDVGVPLTLEPKIWPRDDNRLGADVLKSTDILFLSPARRISFRNR